MKSIRAVALGWALLCGSTTGLAAELKVFFGNLHSHTSYSDGSGKPVDAYKYARSRIDFLAITEHNHKAAEKGIKNNDPRRDGILIAKDPSLYNGAAAKSLISAAKKYNKDNEFIALYGQEFSVIDNSSQNGGGNHVNVYEINDVIDENVVTNGGFGQLVAWLQTHLDSEGKPAIIQFNHPQEDLRAKKIEYGMDDFATPAEWIKAMSKHACLIEVWNGPGTVKATENLKPEDFRNDYFHYLNLGFKLAPTANQDNHHKDWGDRTVARTGIIAESKTKAAFLDALRKRHVYATLDPNLTVMFGINGHVTGDVITTLPSAGSELNIAFIIEDKDEENANYEIEVYSDKPGGDVAKMIEKVTISGNTPATATQKLQDIPFTGEGQYVFFLVRQLDADGKADLAITAPVWFEAAPAAPPVVPGAVDPDAANFVASVNSSLYHVSGDCVAAKAIKPANRITGPSAAQGRTRHSPCPFKPN
jgi:hypothetical protein